MWILYKLSFHNRLYKVFFSYYRLFRGKWFHPLQKAFLPLLPCRNCYFLCQKCFFRIRPYRNCLNSFLCQKRFFKITLQKVFLPLQTLKKCLLYYKLPQKVFLPLNTLHKAFLPFALCRNYLIHCRKGFFYYRLLIRKCFFYYTLSRNCLLTHSLQKLLLPLLKSSLHKMIKDTAKTFFSITANEENVSSSLTDSREGVSLIMYSAESVQSMINSTKSVFSIWTPQKLSHPLQKVFLPLQTQQKLFL